MIFYEELKTEYLRNERGLWGYSHLMISSVSEMGMMELKDTLANNQ